MGRNCDTPVCLKSVVMSKVWEPVWAVLILKLHSIHSTITQLCLFPVATFDGKQHLLSLPVVNSVGYVLRFLKKLCRSLLCENLFSDQPIALSSSPSSSSSAHTDKHSDGQSKSSECTSFLSPVEHLLPSFFLLYCEDHFAELCNAIIITPLIRSSSSWFHYHADFLYWYFIFFVIMTQKSINMIWH